MEITEIMADTKDESECREGVGERTSVRRGQRPGQQTKAARRKKART